MTSEKTIYLSKKGMKELKKRVAKLQRERQSTIVALRESDKTSTRDNRLERIDQLEALDIVEAELAEKERCLENAKLYPRKRDAFKVAAGSIVDLIDIQGRIIRYQIVDSIEADPSDGRISTDSPLGQSLIGRTLQETVTWGREGRNNKLQLVGIM